MASQVASTQELEGKKKMKDTEVTKTKVTKKEVTKTEAMETETMAKTGAGVKAVGAAANLEPPEEAMSGPTAKTPPEKETEGATSKAIAKTLPEKNEMGVKPKKRARAREAPQSQEREEGPATKPTNPPPKRPDSTPGGAKEGSQVQTEKPPRLFKPGGMAKYYRKLARKAAKKAKLEKGNQAVKAPEEPGAKTSEEHKVEGGGEGTERGLEVGVKGNELLIYT
jgi:hypothetical protein